MGNNDDDLFLANLVNDIHNWYSKYHQDANNRENLHIDVMKGLYDHEDFKGKSGGDLSRAKTKFLIKVQEISDLFHETL